MITIQPYAQGILT